MLIRTLTLLTLYHDVLELPIHKYASVRRGRQVVTPSQTRSMAHTGLEWHFLSQGLSSSAAVPLILGIEALIASANNVSSIHLTWSLQVDTSATIFRPDRFIMVEGQTCVVMRAAPSLPSPVASLPRLLNSFATCVTGEVAAITLVASSLACMKDGIHGHPQDTSRSCRAIHQDTGTFYIPENCSEAAGRMRLFWTSSEWHYDKRRNALPLSSRAAVGGAKQVTTRDARYSMIVRSGMFDVREDELSRADTRRTCVHTLYTRFTSMNTYASTKVICLRRANYMERGHGTKFLIPPSRISALISRLSWLIRHTSGSATHNPAFEKSPEHITPPPAESLLLLFLVDQREKDVIRMQLTIPPIFLQFSTWSCGAGSGMPHHYEDSTPSSRITLSSTSGPLLPTYEEGHIDSHSNIAPDINAGVIALLRVYRLLHASIAAAFPSRRIPLDFAFWTPSTRANIPRGHNFFPLFLHIALTRTLHLREGPIRFDTPSEQIEPN
ncbi:hypothetical protein BC629DRAFT_1441077 [Irpex lacteus]|nr:hypothetical protein BC629DRAFT_1441077 [Irpex lacteus]